MRILIADDEPIARDLLETTLRRWGYEVSSAGDGAEAWQVLQSPDSPRVAILDWMMPSVSGIEICERLQQLQPPSPVQVLLLTSRLHRDDLVRGFEAGACDYVTKPFERLELQARVRAAVRMAELQGQLAARVAELQEALAQVRQLEGILPICMYCKKIRDEADYWQQVEFYISKHSEARFSHGVCPECFEVQMALLRRERSGGAEDA